jgi:hypothetical protein
MAIIFHGNFRCGNECDFLMHLSSYNFTSVTSEKSAFGLLQRHCLKELLLVNLRVFSDIDHQRSDLTDHSNFRCGNGCDFHQGSIPTVA